MLSCLEVNNNLFFLILHEISSAVWTHFSVLMVNQISFTKNYTMSMWLVTIYFFILHKINIEYWTPYSVLMVKQTNLANYYSMWRYLEVNGNFIVFSVFIKLALLSFLSRLHHLICLCQYCAKILILFGFTRNYMENIEQSYWLYEWMGSALRR